MIRDWREEYDVLEFALTKAANLVAALDMLAWQFSQHSLEGELEQIRRGVCGVSDALEREISLALDAPTIPAPAIATSN